MEEKQSTESSRAFRELLDLLREADQTFLSGPRAGMDEIGVAEGYRHLTHLLGYGLDLYLEGDAARPCFTPLASPTRKMLGDNVDSRYFFAPIDGRRGYRIRGMRGNEVYLAFCIYGGEPNGEWSRRVVANISQRDIAFDAEGRFDVVLSPDPPTMGTTWVKLEPDAVCVITREYYTDPRTAQMGHFKIEAIAPAPPPPPFGDAQLAHRLRAVTTFVRETIAFSPIPPLPAVNMLMPPAPWNPNIPGWGTPDNVYALGQFELEPDECLIVSGRSPRCVYWGMQLWNRYMQSLDYRYHQVSINGSQATLEADGSFRVTIAHRNTGVPNWLDTAGHREGLFFCRWLQADELPPPPTCQVVKVSPRSAYSV